MSLYGKLEYWEDRYKKYIFNARDPEPFDWYQRY